MTDSLNIGVVILAAGSSSRLGRPKQLVDFQNRPLLQHAIDHASSFNLHPKVLVLGARSDQIKKTIDPKEFSIAENGLWSEGLASSIRLGVTESKNLNGSLEGILFLLSDQPFVSSELIEELIQTHRSGTQKITACRYNGSIGVPAIFGKSCFPELLKLSGDAGAKKIISQHNVEVKSIAFDKGAFDIDTEEDVHKLHAKKFR